MGAKTCAVVALRAESRDKFALLTSLASSSPLESRAFETMSIPAGTEIGRYKILSKLGEGGMGEVYLAQDTKPGEVWNATACRRFGLG